MCRPLFSSTAFLAIPNFIDKSLDVFFGISAKIPGRSLEGFLGIDDGGGGGIVDHDFAVASLKKEDFIALPQVEPFPDFNRNRYRIPWLNSWAILGGGFFCGIFPPLG